MKPSRLLFTVAGLFSVSVAPAAVTVDDTTLLRRIADKICAETRFELVTVASNAPVSIAEAAASPEELVVASPLASWSYTTALVIDGLERLGAQLEEPRYREFGNRVFAWQFSAQNLAAQTQKKKDRIRGLAQFDQLRSVWGTGDMAAALTEVMRDEPREDYRAYLERVAAFFRAYPHRAPHGAFLRNTIGEGGAVVEHDLYPPAVFLGRLGRLTGETRHYEAALDQVEAFFAALWDPHVRLLSHIALPGTEYRSGIFWCRGNGWVAMGLADLLENLPADHPRRPVLLRHYRELVYGLNRWQTKSGLWRHVLDREDSEPETSGSAMIVYAIAKGVNQGWLDPLFRVTVIAGWAGLKSQMDDAGNIDGGVGSVGVSVAPAYLVRVPVEKNDLRGPGPVLLAGQEMLTLLKKYPKPRPNDWRN